MKFQHTFIALATSAMFLTSAAQAVEVKPLNSANPAHSAKMTDRQMARSDNMKSDREQLQQKLRAGKSRADYAKILKDDGYRISSINKDEKDYLEYEVVKAGNSFEVQIDFKDGATKATDVEVEPNMWRADATKRMVKDENYKHAGELVVDPKARYSDSRFMKGWNDEKDQLEKALPKNLKAADYRAKLESLGYKVTAVNDKEKDYVEYEIAKGENSYEVQIDLDESTGKAKEIDVTSNLWEAEATDRATERAEDAKK